MKMLIMRVYFVIDLRNNIRCVDFRENGVGRYGWASIFTILIRSSRWLGECQVEVEIFGRGEVMGSWARDEINYSRT